MENSNTPSQKRPRTESKPRFMRLKDLDVVDCPVCYEPFTFPIFQCENGHLVCSICLAKVKNKCPGPACELRIGKKRCFSMEKVLESVVVLCQNAGFGCPKSFYYENLRNLSSHEKECKYLKCSCPKLGCNYSGLHQNVFCHFYLRHYKDSSNVFFKLGISFTVKININDKSNLVLLEESETLPRVYVVQCFREEHGVYVTIRHLLSSLSNVEKFNYEVTYSAGVDGDFLVYGSPEVKRFYEASSQTPKESFMLVPYSLLGGEMLDAKFCIKLNKK